MACRGGFESEDQFLHGIGYVWVGKDVLIKFNGS